MGSRRVAMMIQSRLPAPQAMGRPALGGVNLAITYGMGLIGGALVIAAVYMWACGGNVRRADAEGRL